MTNFIMQPIICPKCHSVIPPGSKFCPQCGNPIVDPNQAISVGRQIWIYAICLLAPPFGIIYTFKFVGKANPQVRRVGWIALILTILATIITVWSAIGLYNSLQQGLQSYVNTSY